MLRAVLLPTAMRLATLAVLACMSAPLVGAQPLTFSQADGPWRTASIGYAAGDGFVLTRGEYGGTLHRSFDGGGSWEPLPDAPELRGVQLYQGALVAGSPAGLVASTDNGSTWATVAFDGVSVSGIAAPDSLYLQDATGQVYRSGGDLGRWTALDLPAQGGFAPLAAGPGGRLAHLDRYLDGQRTLRLSDDYGETVTPSSVFWPPSSLAFVDGTLYGVRSRAYYGPFEQPGGLFRFDGGDAGFARIRGSATVGPIRRQPDGLVTYTGDGVVRRLAGGSALAVPSVPGPIHDAVFFASSTLVTGAAEYGPPPMPDGSRFVRTAFGMLSDRGDGFVHTGIYPSAVGAVARDAEGRLLVGGDGDVYRFERGWRAVGAGVPQARALVPLWGDPDSLMAVADYGDEAGFAMGPSPVLVGDAVVEIPEFQYACDEGSVSVLTFVSDRGIYGCVGYLGYNSLRTVDRGGFPEYRLGKEVGRLSSLLVTGGGRVFAGASARAFEDEPADVPVYVSEDLGETWAPASAGLVGESVLALAEHDGAVFAGTSTGIFRLDVAP